MRGRPGLLLVPLVAASAALRYWAASRIPSPWITPDEQTYAELGRSLWRAGSFDILGHSTEPLSLVHPALIGIPLSAFGAETGYAVAKALQAVVMSLAAVPVYLWGRSLMRPRWALAAAALTLASPGLVYTGFLMTEVAFYPVLVLVAWAMAAALEEPTLDRQALLLGTMLLAFATRLQAVVLVPVLVLALLLYAWLSLRASNTVLLARRFVPLFGGIAAVAVVWSVLVLRGHRSASGLLGTYGAAAQGSYHAGSVVKFALYHVGDLVLATGVFAVVALALLVARGRAETPGVRGFLAVTTACAAGLVAEVGLFASRNLGRLGERYLLALAPLCFLALALWLDRGAPRPRVVTAAVAAGALAVLAVLPARFFGEAAGPDAPATVLVRDAFGGHVRMGLALVAAALLALGEQRRGDKREAHADVAAEGITDEDRCRRVRPGGLAEEARGQDGEHGERPGCDGRRDHPGARRAAVEPEREREEAERREREQVALSEPSQVARREQPDLG